MHAIWCSVARLHRGTCGLLRARYEISVTGVDILVCYLHSVVLLNLTGYSLLTYKHIRLADDVLKDVVFAAKEISPSTAVCTASWEN